MSLWRKIQRARAEGRLTAEVVQGIQPSLRGLRWVLRDPAAGRIRLQCPEYVDPPDDPAERALVARIFEAFRRMKQDQPKARNAARYLPSALWQRHLEEAYGGLGTGWRDGNVAAFHHFLANFGTWKTYTGIEYSTFIRKNMASPLTRSYLRNEVFGRQLEIWRWLYDGRKPLSALTYPTFGNQVGAYVDGVFVGANSYFKEYYGSLLSGIMADRDRPVLGELGAGYGKLAYFALRDLPRFCFVDFDLPETLCLAAYYLMKVWPEKKALLYGEADYGPGRHREYDLIFMPAYEIEKIGSDSVDLFINHTSLGEMTKEAVENYLAYVADATRYFFHLNHDITPNHYGAGARGYLGHEYPLPPGKFKQLFRYPDIGHMLFAGGLDFKMDIFIYLYERMGDRSPGNGN